MGEGKGEARRVLFAILCTLEAIAVPRFPPDFGGAISNGADGYIIRLFEITKKPTCTLNTCFSKRYDWFRSMDLDSCKSLPQIL